MERCGIRGVALNRDQSYLTERQQYVQMGEFKSGCLGIACGVPKASVMGPKFFNLHINDIFKESD